ncbi:hypothetical protein J6590_024968 [Homalodisca vitripennis]|nr:hypothetical protein J6590_024968 [Homalodisca vitripennis]
MRVVKRKPNSNQRPDDIEFVLPYNRILLRRCGSGEVIKSPVTQFINGRRLNAIQRAIGGRVILSLFSGKTASFCGDEGQER